MKSFELQLHERIQIMMKKEVFREVANLIVEAQAHYLKGDDMQAFLTILKAETLESKMEKESGLIDVKDIVGHCLLCHSPILKGDRIVDKDFCESCYSEYFE